MPLANTVRMDDGFATLITFANAPTVKLYEREVTPPAVSGGGPIETTTMRNLAWRTQSPKKLKTSGQVSATVAYASDAIPVMKTQIGVNQLITISYPDGSHITFWGWPEAFTPGAHAEGAQPTANLVVQPSNHDNSGVEVAPDYIAPAASS